MGVFRQFPYSNFHEMNMDEIIKIVKNMLEEWAEYHATWDEWMQSINDDWDNYQEVMNEAWQNMQNFINNYFNNLDVQNEINNKIISMVNSGEFASIVAPYIPNEVTTWLATHITEPTGVVIDTSLSVSGACADAKVTGDYLRTLENNISDEGYLLLTADDLQQGEWISGSISATTSRLCTKELYRVLSGTSIKFNSTTDLDIAIVVFDADGNTLENTGYVNSTSETEYVIQNTGYVGIVFKRTGGSYMNPATYTTAGAVTKVYCAIGSQFKLLTDLVLQTVGIPDMAISIATLTGILINGTWEKGSISSAGDNTSSNITIRTANYIDVDLYSFVDFAIETGFKFGWHLYDTDKTHIASAPAYITDDTTLAIPTGAKYIRLNIAKVESDDADLSWAENLTINGIYPIVEQVKNIENITGTGDNIYTGEKISFETNNTICRCNIALWKSYKLVDYPDLADYHLNSNQAFAIFGNYGFLFNSGGTIAVINMTSKDLIDYVELSLTNRNHQNSAQFSDIFYDENDEFPLIFVSRCGNATTGSGDDTCLVYRITRSGTTFTFTLINTITSDIDTNGNSWFIDLNEKTIGFVGFINGIYSVTENNPTMFYKWKMPDATNIISGTPITLTSNNLMYTASIEHCALQSACGNGGIVYIGVGEGNETEYVYAVDMIKNYVKTIVPLVDLHEVEGVTIDNGIMYVTHRTASDSIGTNPLSIYSIAF